LAVVNAATPVGRRSFVLGALALTATGAVGASLVGVAPRAFADTGTRTAWVLKTDGWSSARGNPLRTHCKCAACVRHASNKIFATLADASDATHRAHPGCLCEPAMIQLPTAVWTSLFGTTSVVDRRRQLVTAALAGSQPVSTTAAAPAALLPAAGSASALASGGALTGQPQGPDGAPMGSATFAGPVTPTGGTTSASPPVPVASKPDPALARGATSSASGHGGSRLLALEATAAALAVGIGALVWWRRRNDDDQAGDAAT
jgi:hypothetical protein